MRENYKFTSKQVGLILSLLSQAMRILENDIEKMESLKEFYEESGMQEEVRSCTELKESFEQQEQDIVALNIYIMG